MDYFELKDSFDKQNNGTVLSFDDSCVKKIEVTLYDGAPSEHHHIEYGRVKVTTSDGSMYYPINAHRQTISWSDFKDKIAAPEIESSYQTAKIARQEKEAQYEAELEAQNAAARFAQEETVEV